MHLLACSRIQFPEQTGNTLDLYSGVPSSNSAGLPATLSESVYGFAQSFQANSEIIPSNKPLPDSYVFLPTYHSWSYFCLYDTV
jgi:hypothetical protein